MHAFNAFFFCRAQRTGIHFALHKRGQQQQQKTSNIFFLFYQHSALHVEKKMKIIVALPNAQIPSLSPLLSRLHFVRIFGTHKISTIDLFQCG